MTKLLLVRHGQSEWNAMGRWQGKANPPLTDLGKEQALIAAKKLPDFSILASSDLVRARETAEIFAKAHDKDSNDILIEPQVQERDAGEFSGLTRDEIEKKERRAALLTLPSRLPSVPSKELRNSWSASSFVILPAITCGCLLTL